jgi:uncharacterized protein (TIGR03000 family)
MPKAEPAPKPKEGSKEASLARPATLVVSLPAEAKLQIDGVATTSTSATRVFTSPTLNPGKDYQYELKAEMVVNGQTMSTTKTVIVRAGEETRVQIDIPVSVAAR